MVVLVKSTVSQSWLYYYVNPHYIPLDICVAKLTVIIYSLHCFLSH